jgi:hypothetical protein
MLCTLTLMAVGLSPSEWNQTVWWQRSNAFQVRSARCVLKASLSQQCHGIDLCRILQRMYKRSYHKRVLSKHCVLFAPFKNDVNLAIFSYDEYSENAS